MIAFWNNCPILKLNYRGISEEDESHSSMLTRTKCSRISHLLSFMLNTNSRVPRKICQGPLCHYYMCQRTLSCAHLRTHILSGDSHFLTPDPARNISCLTSASPHSTSQKQFIHCLNHMTQNCSLSKNAKHPIKLKWFVST